MSDSTFNGQETGTEVKAPEKVDWVEKAIEYEATPKSLREPKEKGDFIKSLGIPVRTYYYNIGKTENKARIVKIWLNEALNDGNEVLQKLAEKAKAGDMKAIELYMKFVLELAENLDIKSGGQSIVINQMFYDRDNNTSQIHSKGLPITISPSNTEPKI